MSIKKNQAVRVFAPATIANVAVGYDILGLAIDGPGDEVLVRRVESRGVTISKIHGTKKALPKDPTKNTAGLGVLSYLSELGLDHIGIEIEIFKKMPFGSGLGSSAASSAASIHAVNELLGRPLQKRELAKYAILGESAADGAIHGDNVLPALLGGIVLIRDNDTSDFIKLPTPEGIHVFVIYPDIEILTKNARAILSDQIGMRSFIKQTGNLGSLVASLYTSDFELMGRSLRDHVIEPQRASSIPHFYEMQDMALSLGAMNYTISGAGPSMFGFALNNLIAEGITEKISDFLHTKQIRSRTHVSKINNSGAIKR